MGNRERLCAFLKDLMFCRSSCCLFAYAICTRGSPAILTLGVQELGNAGQWIEFRHILRRNVSVADAAQ